MPFNSLSRDHCSLEHLDLHQQFVAELSTPSLGITCRICSTSASSSSNGFQLPLSGSLANDALLCFLDRLLSTPSLGITDGSLIELKKPTSATTFNSLSRDHKRTVFGSNASIGFVAFNSLSRDHDACPVAGSERDRPLRLSTPSLGITTPAL